MTCCVREAADTRLYGQVASLKNIPLRSGTPLSKRIVAVGGCIGQRDGERLVEKLPHLDVVFGTHNLASLPRLLQSAVEKGGHHVEVLDAASSFASELPASLLGLAVDPDILRERIDARVDAMVQAGLVSEVKGLLNHGFRTGVTAPQAIGYKEIVAALEHDTTMEEAIERIKTATRRYARRQRPPAIPAARPYALHERRWHAGAVVRPRHPMLCEISR